MSNYITVILFVIVEVLCGFQIRNDGALFHILLEL